VLACSVICCALDSSCCIGLVSLSVDRPAPATCPPASSVPRKIATRRMSGVHKLESREKLGAHHSGLARRMKVFLVTLLGERGVLTPRWGLTGGVTPPARQPVP